MDNILKEYVDNVVKEKDRIINERLVSNGFDKADYVFGIAYQGEFELGKLLNSMFDIIEEKGINIMDYDTEEDNIQIEMVCEGIEESVWFSNYFVMALFKKRCF